MGLEQLVDGQQKDRSRDERQLSIVAETWARLNGGGQPGKAAVHDPNFRDYLEKKGTSAPQISPLFDVHAYAQYFPDRAEKVNLLEHYCTWGWHLGYLPHVIFDNDWVSHLKPARGRSPAGAVPPLLHLLRCGADASPNPLFESKHYRESVGKDFLNGQRPIEAFIDRWHEKPAGFSSWFSWRFYQFREPLVRQARINPLIHYCTIPIGQRNDANPLFHSLWYRANYKIPEDRDPFMFFVTEGFDAGHLPNPFAYEEVFKGVRATKAVPVTSPVFAEALRDYMDARPVDVNWRADHA